MEINGVSSGGNFIPPKFEQKVETKTKQTSGASSAKVDQRSGEALEPKKLSYRIDEEIDRLIVSVIDSDTGETVRQIPPEELVSLVHKLEEALQNMVNETA